MAKNKSIDTRSKTTEGDKIRLKEHRGHADSHGRTRIGGYKSKKGEKMPRYHSGKGMNGTATE